MWDTINGKVETEVQDQLAEGKPLFGRVGSDADDINRRNNTKHKSLRSEEHV